MSLCYGSGSPGTLADQGLSSRMLGWKSYLTAGVFETLLGRRIKQRHESLSLEICKSHSWVKPSS